jgi:uncharacterized protein YqeY
MATIYEKLRSDIIAAMKAGDRNTATALRTTDAAIQRAAMDLNKAIDDSLVVTSLRKSIKNLSDATVEFAKGGRADLIAANEAEVKILEKYLPQGLSADRIEALITEAMQATAAVTKKDMGKVIGALKKHPEAGSIDFGAISKLIQSKLP